MATGFIPTSLIEGITAEEDARRKLSRGPFIFDQWQKGEFINLAYCGECEGSDWMSRNIIAQWEEALGIKIKQVPLTNEQYQQSVREQDAGMVFLAKGGYGWYTFLHEAMVDFMYSRELQHWIWMRLDDAALETDSQKRKEIILEIDRWLTQEEYFVIPINYFEQCE